MRADGAASTPGLHYVIVRRDHEEEGDAIPDRRRNRQPRRQAGRPWTEISVGPLM